MINLPMAPLVSSEPMRDDERQMTRGISHCHNQLNKLAEQVFDSSTLLGAVANVLQARGLISEEELAEQRQLEGQRLQALFQERQIGVQLDMRTPDKYAIPPEDVPIIDCESRYHLCHAACCALRFALTTQDLEEGVMRWELGEPYRNRVGPDNHCVHIDRGTFRCSIYEHRPGICRVYDCRKDNRIWLNFEERIINPDLYTVDEDGKWHFAFKSPKAAAPDSGEQMQEQAVGGVTSEQ